MEAVFHPLVQSDLKAALKYYDAEGGSKLGDRFFDDAESTVGRVLENPKRFHSIRGGIRRRASFKSFPYHFIFEERGNVLRFLVIRHDKRHPNYGLRRR